MARTRERAGRTRDRTPPPRMSGPGLVQVALFAGLLAVVVSFVGVLLAGSAEEPALEANADQLGAGLAIAFSTPDPSAWKQDFRTTKDAIRLLKTFYPELELGTGKSDEIRQQWNFHQGEANKDRIHRNMKQLSLQTGGVLRGVVIRSTDTEQLGDQTWGAIIDTSRFASQWDPGAGGVEAARMTATQPGGSPFAARVYHRQYRSRQGQHVGDVYVILSQAAVQRRGGAGIWLFLTPLLVAAAIGFLIATNSRAAGDLKGLARDLDSVGRGRLDQRVQVGGTGEVGFVQRTAERMVKNLTLIQSTGSTDLDEAIEKELDTAQQIHESLRPSDPPRIPGYELETIFKGGTDIGGDYYDYVELDENRIALLIADCSQSLRGVPAAMVMAMTRAYLRAAIAADASPGDWLRSVNRRLARDLKSGMAVTAQVMVIDTTTHEAIVASAGHRPVVVWRQGKTATINPNGIALGLDVGPVFDKTLEEKKFTFQKNDRVVLYTDGMVSATNDEGEEYGEARFTESVRKQGPMNSAAFVNFVVGGVDRFLGEAEQNDDITIMTLKRMK